LKPTSNELFQQEQPAELLRDTFISFVIPAFNECNRIIDSVATIENYLQCRFAHYEIIVVDDGSKDNTLSKISTFESNKLRVLSNATNKGKGYSVRKGLLAAGGDVVLFTDADLSTPINDADILLHALLNEGADVAIASRAAAAKEQIKRTWFRAIQAKAFAMLVNLLVVKGFADTQCGMKGFKRKSVLPIFERMRINRWSFDVELLYIAKKFRLDIAELPVTWEQRDDSKLSLLSPFNMFVDLLRIRLNAIRGVYQLPP